MGVDDRAGLAAHAVSQEDKLSRTFSVPAHASGQNVSQVWRAGPVRVRLDERAGETWVVVEAEAVEVLQWAVAAGWSYRLVVELFGPRRRVGWELPLTPALDRFLVELVDVIADVRRAAGTVQLELEGLEEEDDVHSADL